MRMDWLTEMTGKPVCFATRSAVRWRVPDSLVSIEDSGKSWTAARTIRLVWASTTTAPSILASSRRRVAENSTSRGKPPELIASTVLSWPSTTSAPVRPRRMRSRPSRRDVPGATAARVVRKRSWGFGCVTTHGILRLGSPGAEAARRARSGPRGDLAGGLDGCREVGDLDERDPRGHLPRVDGHGGHDRAREAQPRGLGEPDTGTRDSPQLAREPDLTHRDDAARERLVVEVGDGCEGERKVDSGLGEARAAHGRDVDVLVADRCAH